MKCLLITYCTALLFGFSIPHALNRIEGRTDKARIIGGKDAAAGQFPYMAAINVTTRTSRYFCSGALANDRWLITSATCVYNATLFTIRLGSIYLDGTDAHIFATSIYEIHPDFDHDTFRADVGLIRLRMWISQTDYVKSLVTYALLVDATTEARSIGWGHTGDFDSALSNRLKYVDVTVLSDEACRGYYGNQVTQNMMCVIGEYNEGTCIGDTGGPLSFFEYDVHWIIGIASFISGNGCESAEPSGYTRIGPYMQWIDSFVYNWVPPDE